MSMNIRTEKWNWPFSNVARTICDTLYIFMYTENHGILSALRYDVSVPCPVRFRLRNISKIYSGINRVLRIKRGIDVHLIGFCTMVVDIEVESIMKFNRVCSCA